MPPPGIDPTPADRARAAAELGLPDDAPPAAAREAFLRKLPAEDFVPSTGLCVALLGVSFALLNYAFDEISNPALRPVRRRRARARS